jgi:hypothetical protein
MRTPIKVGLIAVMAIGSLAMWIVTPLAWVYGAAQLSAGSQLRFGHVLMILVGIPVTMVVIGKGLGSLNRFYGRVTQTTPDVRIRAPWNRSLRGDRDERHPRSILDVVMVCSVSVALALMAVWFLFFARGGGLPNT